MMKIRHILVGTDFSEGSQRAFARALALSRDCQAGVTLFHAVKSDLILAIRERLVAYGGEVLREWIASLPDTDRTGITGQIEAGDPLTMILSQADEADLIVVGASSKKGLKEFLVGTTTERLVRHSERPVLVVKQPVKGPYRRVLVAVDFSEGASRALEAAYQMAPGADFLLVHAWQVTPVGFGSLEMAQKKMDAQNELLRKRLERQAQDHLLKLGSSTALPRIEMRAGNPVTVLREALQSYSPDLLAMGSHARSGMAIAMLGSMAREFLVEAPCDVLVTRV
jgi:nucleotide-binding universal stress UspA family protein